MKFYIRKVRGGFRWRIRSRNGKIPGQQKYSRHIDAENAIRAIIKACAGEESKIIADE